MKLFGKTKVGLEKLLKEQIEENTKLREKLSSEESYGSMIDDRNDKLAKRNNYQNECIKTQRETIKALTARIERGR